MVSVLYFIVDGWHNLLANYGTGLLLLSFSSLPIYLQHKIKEGLFTGYVQTGNISGRVFVKRYDNEDFSQREIMER